MTTRLHLETELPTGVYIVCTALVPVGIATLIDDEATPRRFRVRLHGRDAGTWHETAPRTLEPDSPEAQ